MKCDSRFRDSPQASKLDKRSALEIRDGNGIPIRVSEDTLFLCVSLERRVWVYNVQPDHADRLWIAPERKEFEPSYYLVLLLITFIL
jgi:hypothetical protein